jgi:hypothetical protein
MLTAMQKRGFAILLPTAVVSSAFVVFPSAQPPSSVGTNEKHLSNIRQLTFGGENAKAYFTPYGMRLIFQATRAGYGAIRSAR